MLFVFRLQTALASLLFSNADTSSASTNSLVATKIKEEESAKHRGRGTVVVAVAVAVCITYFSIEDKKLSVS